jgi:catechol 2,3-dioxygenase-like lactoylglutathione lyase family enzyme
MPDGGSQVTGVLGCWHVGVAVQDMERSLSFYRDGLGLTVVIDRVADDEYLREVNAVESTSIRIVYLSVPGTDFRIELLEHRGAERIPIHGRPCDPGISHIGLYVDDVEEIVRRLVAAGYQSRSAQPVTIAAGPYRGARSCFMMDPDGMLVELFQKPGSS